MRKHQAPLKGSGSSGTTRTKREASQRLGELQRRKSAGRLAAPTKVTVDEWLDEWFGRARENLLALSQRRILRRPTVPVTWFLRPVGQLINLELRSRVTPGSHHHRPDAGLQTVTVLVSLSGRPQYDAGIV